MDWQIEIDRKALKSLKKIPEPYKSSIIESIDKLPEEPRPEGCRKLKGANDLWRIRVNTYRIIYQVKDAKLKILIIRIAHRSDVYRGY